MKSDKRTQVITQTPAPRANRRLIVACCLACVVLGYMVGQVKGLDPLSPLTPGRDRPVLRLLSRVAKIGLWVAVFAEPSPQAPEVQYAHTRRHYTEGSLVCHQEGW